MDLKRVAGTQRVTKSDNKLRASLVPFLNNEALDEIFDDLDALSHPVKLRRYVGDLLKGNDHLLAIKTCSWVVGDWGHIHTGHNSLKNWYDEWEGFQRGKILDFINRIGSDRIASWSKLLSFAYPQFYPVYDARNGSALNCVLKQIGIARRFPRVGTRVRAAKEVFDLMHKHMGQRYDLNYHQYNSLIDYMARSKFDGNILEAELSLFQGSKHILSAFLEMNQGKRSRSSSSYGSSHLARGSFIV